MARPSAIGNRIVTTCSAARPPTIGNRAADDWESYRDDWGSYDGWWFRLADIDAVKRYFGGCTIVLKSGNTVSLQGEEADRFMADLT